MFFPLFKSNSSKKFYNHTNVLVTSITTLFFASIVERVTIFYNFSNSIDCYITNCVYIPIVIFLMSLSPIISTSLLPCRSKFDFPKYKVESVVPYKYLIIHFIASHYCFPRLFIYLLATHIGSSTHHDMHKLSQNRSITYLGHRGPLLLCER